MNNKATFNALLEQAHKADVYTYHMDGHIHTMVYDTDSNLLAEAWEDAVDGEDIYQIY